MGRRRARCRHRAAPVAGMPAQWSPGSPVAEAPLRRKIWCWPASGVSPPKLPEGRTMVVAVVVPSDRAFAPCQYDEGFDPPEGRPCADPPRPLASPWGPPCVEGINALKQGSHPQQALQASGISGVREFQGPAPADGLQAATAAHWLPGASREGHYVIPRPEVVLAISTCPLICPYLGTSGISRLGRRLASFPETEEARQQPRESLEPSELPSGQPSSELPPGRSRTHRMFFHLSERDNDDY